jgi:hypothetical protein
MEVQGDVASNVEDNNDDDDEEDEDGDVEVCKDEDDVAMVPRNSKLSEVKVPVLSKQHTSTFPANGIRKGSVQ